MTALPDRPPRRLPAVATGLLTVAQYAALGETEDGYTELVNGRLIMSPSPLADHNVTGSNAKRHEYAKAGIPFYWIIDLDEPVSLAPMHLAGPFGYQEVPVETQVYETDAPFPLKIQVDRLID
ncbi:PDDEXK family nuclease [Lentzea nigeriaca]|uniref:hypothetical protein n=1 Tax=Lentzea nigeriaca TaxID=1128665 RepID=UPI001957B942|nr:hypothetical protein [Lentzea nigeriaca]MBM7858124.1 Uma2 family endonuclease [Lentzea nigeriaca]